MSLAKVGGLTRPPTFLLSVLLCQQFNCLFQIFFGISAVLGQVLLDLLCVLAPFDRRLEILEVVGLFRHTGRITALYGLPQRGVLLAVLLRQFADHLLGLICLALRDQRASEKAAFFSTW